MSNITATYPIATASTDASGNVTGTYVDNTSTTQPFSITAADLGGITVTTNEVINLLDDGKFTITTPEFAIAAAPVTTVSLVEAIATIAAVTSPVYASITFASGAVVSVADLTSPVTLNLAPATAGNAA